MIKTFWLFLNNKDKKFGQNFTSNFLPFPPGEGGIKIEVVENIFVEPKLLNMNFETHKNKTKSKRWALYLKIWVSYGNFCETRLGKISISQNFEISLNFLDFCPIFCMLAQSLNRSNL